MFCTSVLSFVHQIKHNSQLLGYAFFFQLALPVVASSPWHCSALAAEFQSVSIFTWRVFPEWIPWACANFPPFVRTTTTAFKAHIKIFLGHLPITSLLHSSSLILGHRWCCLHAKLHQSCPTLCEPMGQVPLSMGSSRQEHWCELPCPPPEDLPDPIYLALNSKPPLRVNLFSVGISHVYRRYAW